MFLSKDLQGRGCPISLALAWIMVGSRWVLHEFYKKKNKKNLIEISHEVQIPSWEMTFPHIQLRSKDQGWPSSSDPRGAVKLSDVPKGIEEVLQQPSSYLVYNPEHAREESEHQQDWAIKTICVGWTTAAFQSSKQTFYHKVKYFQDFQTQETDWAVNYSFLYCTSAWILICK